VIDNRTVITGSFNWSPLAAHQNDEVLLVIESPLLAAHFTREMDRLWRDAEAEGQRATGTQAGCEPQALRQWGAEGGRRELRGPAED